MAFLVKISGTDVSFPAEKGERILDAAERAGYDIPHACRSGFCGSCSANVVSGDSRMPRAARKVCRPTARRF